ncbi:MAG: zinc-binding alcohol dehydrogenase [Planctomycetes bacterium]|nr:zinc-binding alcohol dehydrogenase [Planctomycetota bacterium]
MSSRLVFTGKQVVRYETFDAPEPGAGSVAVQTLCSLMSTGTEGIVFERRFDPGTHWDRWVRYPFYPGYASIARVTGAPAGSHLAVGQRVALRAPHASHHVVREDECVPVPDGIDDRSASWFALAKIAFMGARAAQYAIGDSVAIIGAGPIGQMSVRWASALGARTIVSIDTVDSRLELAKRGGATTTIAKPIRDAIAHLAGCADGDRPRVVIDGTGHAEVFGAALEAVRDQGRVVVLGDTGSPAKQALSSHVILRGLTIVGAHDGLRDAHWSPDRICRYFFELALSKRFDLSGLVTHVFDPKDCEKAYGTASSRRGETMGILFDWSAT